MINIKNKNKNFLFKYKNIFKNNNYLIFIIKLFNGDWGLGIGDWGLGPIPNPQSPIPKPTSP